MKRLTANSALRLALGALMLAWLLPLASCRSLIYDDENDCDVTYKLKFVYDYNMKWADAFAHEVKSVRVYIFDESGKLAFVGTESGAQLSEAGYAMELPLPAGNYRAVAWCGADNNPGDEHFSIAGGKGLSVASEAELTAYMARSRNGEGGACSNVNLHPLYYGAIDLSLEDHSRDGGEYIYLLPLTKDTNNIKIVLQDQSGEGVNIEDFEFTITDSNGSMAADNSLVKDETITYLPWAAYSGVAGVELKDKEGLGTITEVSVAQAEFAVPRLMTGHHREMILTIKNKKNGKDVLRIPVIDYLLLVKSLDAGNVTDQEFLDRQDQYSMMFFLAGGTWIASQICINSWRVVLQDHDLN